jgi:hypothetical protein
MLASRVAVLAGCTDVTIDPLIGGLALKPHSARATSSTCRELDDLGRRTLRFCSRILGGQAPSQAKLTAKFWRASADGRAKIHGKSAERHGEDTEPEAV